MTDSKFNNSSEENQTVTEWVSTLEGWNKYSPKELETFRLLCKEVEAMGFDPIEVLKEAVRSKQNRQ